MSNHPPPEPLEESEEDRQARKLGEREERACRLAQGAVAFLLVAGGLTVSAAVLVPMRTAGASRSARLEWQRREAEVARAIESSNPPPSPASR